MKKRIFLIIFNFLMLGMLYSQDQIIRKNGTEYYCKIISIDSTKIDLIVTRGEKQFSTNINLSDVSSYIYNGKKVYVQIINDSIVIKNDSIKQYVFNKSKSFSDSIENLHKCFIYTWSDYIISGNEIELIKPFIGLPYIRLDDNIYNLDLIKFIKSEIGFYANASNLRLSKSSLVPIRVIKGKVNLYEEEIIRVTKPYYNFTTKFYDFGYSYKKIRNFYNIGFGDLKKATYKNLQFDLADNPSINDDLNKYKSISNIQTSLKVMSIVGILGGFASFIIESNNNLNQQNYIVPTASICLGVCSVIINYQISLSKPNYIKKVIYLYNK